jgi:hypothetical protein
MNTYRLFSLVPVFALAACASTTPTAQYAASTDCKIVPGQFVNVPKKNPTAAEQAEAELKMARFAYSRPGYGRLTDMPSEAVRNCY